MATRCQILPSKWYRSVQELSNIRGPAPPIRASGGRAKHPETIPAPPCRRPAPHRSQLRIDPRSAAVLGSGGQVQRWASGRGLEAARPGPAIPAPTSSGPAGGRGSIRKPAARRPRGPNPGVYGLRRYLSRRKGLEGPLWASHGGAVRPALGPLGVGAVVGACRGPWKHHRPAPRRRPAPHRS